MLVLGALAVLASGGVGVFAAEPSAAALKDAHERNKKGAEFFEKRLYERAIAEFNAALRAVPNHPYSMFNIGVCYTRLSREAEEKNRQEQAKAYFQQAKAAYERLLEMHPKIADAWTNLGELYDSKNDVKKAEECYRKAIEVAPNFGAARHNLGVLLENTGRLEQAVEQYRKHVEIEDAKPKNKDGSEPDRDPYAYYSLGVVFLGKGMLKEAKALFIKANVLDPDSIYINNGLGNVYVLEGNAGMALSHFKAAQSKGGDNYAPIHEGLGDVHRLQGNLTEAKNAYARALKLRPDFAAVHFKLGEIAVKDKEDKKAIEFFQNYLKYGKDKRLAQVAQERIKELQSKTPENQ